MVDGLRSSGSTYRLNQIDSVRANGVGGLVSLPQLVVCGDQSAGKSSVLERLTGIPFPRSDGLCTRFPTEIILRHSSGEQQIIATIQPHGSRDSDMQESLRAYHRIISNLSELPSVIREVSTLMRIRGYGNDNQSGDAFAPDTLRIEVSGPTGLHLTVVDLPGLISVSNEEQTEEDVLTVRHMVESYLSSSRTIILAVLQASNDVANQAIVQLARKHDTDGQRTVGIITKPDLINEGTEGKIARLAKNLDNVKLKLGFFLLKNPSPSETALSFDAQCQREAQFFAAPVWQSQSLNMARVGALNLRSFLQELLDCHIEKELPQVRDEVKQLLVTTERQLEVLGEERPTPHQIRSFLTGISMRFHVLTQAALDGNYQGPESEFFLNHTNRLRAMVHKTNEDFALRMRMNGMKRKIERTDPDGNADNLCIQDTGLDVISVTKDEMKYWVTQTYTATRGRELPGNYNHVLLAELFHEQSSRWPDIARRHIDTVWKVVDGWVGEALSLIVAEEDVRQHVSVICQTDLDEVFQQAQEELSKLIADEKRQPITYNHYYTDNIQKARNNANHQSIEQALMNTIEHGFNGKLHVSNLPQDLERLRRSLQTHVIVNMTEQACVEAEAGLHAYYKVAMKTFVDNVCRQAVERHILSPMLNFFCPTRVAQFSDDELLRIGAENERRRSERIRLSHRAEGLRRSLLDLQGLPVQSLP
ncbi:putative GED domain-containing protein [Seiridium cardinale]